MNIYTSVKDELEVVRLVKNSPYTEIYQDGEYFRANLYDGTVTLAKTMDELRQKLRFIAETEVQ
jgi:hypothetical protein